MLDTVSKEELLEVFKAHSAFCTTLLDAYALIDIEGQVVKTNPLFNLLVQKKSKEIYRKSSLDELIKFRIGRKDYTIEDLLSQEHPTRIDEVMGNTSDNRQLNLILGIYPFMKGKKKVGTFLIIRDVTAETKLQAKYKTKSKESVTDQLTGLYNRLYFEQYLPTMLEQMVGEGEDYAISVLMIDVDYFKKINDEYGHLAGDFILQVMGKMLRESCRKSDIVCRYGGEEFLVILPGADLQDSKIVAEKLRKAIEKEIVEFEKHKINITVSIGSAEINVGMETAEQAIARADRALYHSKESGRNMVSLNANGKIIA